MRDNKVARRYGFFLCAYTTNILLRLVHLRTNEPGAALFLRLCLVVHDRQYDAIEVR